MAALLRKIDTVDLSDEVIPDPLADPTYAAAMELLGKFNQRYDRLEKEKLRLHFEQHFQGRPREEDTGNDQPLRERLEALRALPPLEPTPAASPASPSPAIARGISVLAGEKVQVAPSFAAQVAECDRQLAVLGDAIREQTEICTALRGERIEVCAKQVLPNWNSMVLDMYRAAQALSRSTSRFRAYRTRLIQAGICTETLRSPNVIAPLQLGDESVWDSEISRWRRVLEDWNVL